MATSMARRKDRWASLRIDSPNDDFGLIAPWPETIPHLNPAVCWLKRISTFLWVQVVWSTKFQKKDLIGLSKDGILIKPMSCALISFILKLRVFIIASEINYVKKLKTKQNRINRIKVARKMMSVWMSWTAAHAEPQRSATLGAKCYLPSSSYTSSQTPVIGSCRCDWQRSESTSSRPPNLPS